MDLRRFDFQGQGDFILLEVIPLDEDIRTGTPLFSLQGRLERIPSWPGNTVHMALAFGDGDLAFQVRFPYNQN